MTTLIVLAFFVALLAVASIASMRDMRPSRRPPDWSVGRMMQPRH
jgi:hypothetical protein